MAEGLEVLGKLREAFCERPFKDQNVRALLSNSKLLGCLLTQLEPEVDKATISFRPIRPVLLLPAAVIRLHIHTANRTTRLNSGTGIMFNLSVSHPLIILLCNFNACEHN